MVSINSKKVVKVCNEAAVSQSKFSKGLSQGISHSREMEMIPKYLELAVVKGSERFNKKQITAITNGFYNYKTALSKTDLLKDLLAIGEKAGTPLSTEEFLGFLKATSSMKQLEQRNVLRFLKVSKEKEVTNFTPEYFRELCPYETYKKRAIKLYEDTGLAKEKPKLLEEEALQESYNIAIENEVILASNKYHQQSCSGKYKPADYITKNFPDVVKAVATSTDPERFALLVDFIGVNPTVVQSANSLTDAIRLCKDNISLALDLANAFYPPEIKKIVETLSKETSPKVKSNLPTYYQLTYSENHRSNVKNINYARKAILKTLGLEDKIELLPLKTYYTRDIYPATEARGRLLAGGNSERGKKK